jgi:hypothetical protein
MQRKDSFKGPALGNRGRGTRESKGFRETNFKDAALTNRGRGNHTNVSGP